MSNIQHSRPLWAVLQVWVDEKGVKRRCVDSDTRGIPHMFWTRQETRDYIKKTYTNRGPHQQYGCYWYRHRAVRLSLSVAD